MDKICDKCGLPESLCVCETIAKEKEKIRVLTIKRRYGKIITLVEGIGKDADPKSVLKELKTKLACGGTIKENTIELQGNHKQRVRDILVKLGFPEDQIEIT
ncbi:MAG: stress response translation initiation inhibitor YciH [Candidatus Aenigmatarchaeota archaeon]|nr:MAG: stress response translation initiation inhibitor YciH [Candidatus Aenigmarchaeota archaeon]